jgi:hypothetical protein
MIRDFEKARPIAMSDRHFLRWASVTWFTIYGINPAIADWAKSPGGEIALWSPMKMVPPCPPAMAGT